MMMMMMMIIDQSLRAAAGYSVGAVDIQLLIVLIGNLDVMSACQYVCVHILI